MMSYSADFRRHVLSVQQSDRLTNAATIARFGISLSSLLRWKKQPAPKKTRRRPWLKIDMVRLARDLRDHPDAYHRERANRLGCSERGLCDALKRMGVTRKKNAPPSEG